MNLPQDDILGNIRVRDRQDRIVMDSNGTPLSGHIEDDVLVRVQDVPSLAQDEILLDDSTGVRRHITVLVETVNPPVGQNTPSRHYAGGGSGLIK